jgi:hypothetical protein
MTNNGAGDAHHVIIGLLVVLAAIGLTGWLVGRASGGSGLAAAAAVLTAFAAVLAALPPIIRALRGQ